MSGLTPRRTSSGKISAALPSRPTDTGFLLCAASAMIASASSSVLACRSRYPVRSRIEMRLRTGYLDRQASTLDEALAIMADAAQSKKPVSVGLLGNAADIFPELVRRGVRPDIVTDQTSAHDPINGYLPKGWTLAEWELKRNAAPDAVAKAAKQSMAGHVRAMLEFHKL